MHLHIEAIQSLYIMMIQIPMHEPADLDCIYIVKTLERIWIRGSELAVPNVDHSVSMIIA